MSDTGNPAPEHPRTGRDDVVLADGEIDPKQFPRLFNISAGFLYAAIILPLRPEPPEYVALPELDGPFDELATAVAQWNMLWEAGQFRRRYFDHDELPEPLRSVAELGDMNVVFVPRTRSRYHEFAPLLHLLPHRTLRRYGLPLLRAGQWPYQVDYPRIDSFLPGGFERRLSNAWASAIWPHLDSGSSPAAFTDAYPLSLLAHNLEFWVPPVTAMIQNRLRDFPDVKKDNSIPDAVRLVDGSVLDGAIPARPRMGGEVWFGEQDARYAIEETSRPQTAAGSCAGSSRRSARTGLRRTSPTICPTRAPTSSASSTTCASRSKSDS